MRDVERAERLDAGQSIRSATAYRPSWVSTLRRRRRRRRRKKKRGRGRGGGYTHTHTHT